MPGLFHPCFGGTTESVFRFIRLSGPGIGNSQGVEKRGISLLSLTEMYKVAASYEKGSPGYGKVMQVAARYFPDAPAVLNDLALEAMAKKEYDKAVQLLEYSKVTFREAATLYISVKLSKSGRSSTMRRASSRLKLRTLYSILYSLRRKRGYISFSSDDRCRQVLIPATVFHRHHGLLYIHR